MSYTQICKKTCKNSSSRETLLFKNKLKLFVKKIATTKIKTIPDMSQTFERISYQLSKK